MNIFSNLYFLKMTCLDVLDAIGDTLLMSPRKRKPKEIFFLFPWIEPQNLRNGKRSS